MKFLILKNSMIIGNFVSNLIGIHIIDIISLQSFAPPSPEVIDLARKIDWFFQPFAFVTGLIATLIYERPIRISLNAKLETKHLLSKNIISKARRRLLNEPFILMILDLSIWMLAAIVYPGIFHVNGIDGWTVLRVLLQTMLTGIVTIISTFFIIERILQKWLVPILFPSGGLYATPKTIHIRIQTRLVALLCVCNLIPFISILIRLSVSYSMDQSPEIIFESLRSSFLINSLIFVAMGGWVTFLVGKNLTQPFGEIIEVLKNIHQGNLDHRVRVTTNDEIGYTGDVINEMTEGLKEREILRQSLELAREVQQNLLPKSSPKLDDIDISGQSIYCDQTGGDYFDFIEFTNSNRKMMGVLVGDVSGHGVSSALLMATARAFLRLRSAMQGNIAQVVTDVNRQLTQDVGNSGQFMTLFYLLLDPSKSTFRWVRAGHEPAICYDANTDTFKELHGKGIALGINEDWTYEENKMTEVAHGQILLIGTDGIWEACNLKGEMFGKDPLYKIIREHKDARAADIVNKIIDRLDKFLGGRRPEDDITLIVIKI